MYSRHSVTVSCEKVFGTQMFSFSDIRIAKILQGKNANIYNIFICNKKRKE
jgi:hypothetical protein